MKSLHALVALGALVACSPPAPPPAAPALDAAPAFAAGDPPATPGPLAGGNGALGSGCAPGAGPLPDGAWFGYATAWNATGIDFDLACFYSGNAAAAQASAHNDESPPPNDYYIVNDASTTRRVDVAADTIAYRSAVEGVGLERTTYADFVANAGPSSNVACPGSSCSVWVFVNNGRVTEVMWQFFP
jgi:hypothetical protein